MIEYEPIYIEQTHTKLVCISHSDPINKIKKTFNYISPVPTITDFNKYRSFISYYEKK